MNNKTTNNEAYSLANKELLDESLVIPLDGYADEGDGERGKKRYYGFKLNDVQLLLDPDVRSEVMNDAVVTPLPLMPSYVTGLCNVRGNLVPVYNMYKKLGLRASSSALSDKKVLVLDENENMAGIEIQEMVVSLQFDEQDVQYDVYTENELVNRCITYCYTEHGKYWFGFDHIKLFNLVND